MFSLSFHYLQKMSRAFSLITQSRKVAIWLSRQDSLRTSLPASDQNVVDCKRLNNEFHLRCIQGRRDKKPRANCIEVRFLQVNIASSKGTVILTLTLFFRHYKTIIEKRYLLETRHRKQERKCQKLKEG